jgi:hypothetical protein
LDADEAFEAVGLVKPPRSDEHPPLAVIEESVSDDTSWRAQRREIDRTGGWRWPDAQCCCGR